MYKGTEKKELLIVGIFCYNLKINLNLKYYISTPHIDINFTDYDTNNYSIKLKFYILWLNRYYHE
mgnify:CR=1 FL=1